MLSGVSVKVHVFFSVFPVLNSSFSLDGCKERTNDYGLMTLCYLRPACPWIQHINKLISTISRALSTRPCSLIGRRMRPLSQLYGPLRFTLGVQSTIKVRNQFSPSTRQTPTRPTNTTSRDSKQKKRADRQVGVRARKRERKKSSQLDPISILFHPKQELSYFGPILHICSIAVSSLSFTFLHLSSLSVMATHAPQCDMNLRYILKYILLKSKG